MQGKMEGKDIKLASDNVVVRDDETPSHSYTQAANEPSTPEKHGSDHECASRTGSTGSSEYHFHAMLPQATPVSLGKRGEWGSIARAGSAERPTSLLEVSLT